MELQDIVIIGGGATAVSLLYQLQEGLNSSQRLKVTIFEKSTNKDLIGYAYSSRNEELILNTPNDIMGVSPTKPDTFCEWLSKVKCLEYPAKFVPRYLFGEYLKYELDKIVKCSTKLSITLINEAVDSCLLDTEINSINSKNHKVEAKLVVFSHGSTVDPIFPSICNSNKYIKDIYNDTKNIPDGSRILILGSSLSMIDAVILLSQLNNNNNNYSITAASRHGYFPPVKPVYPDVQQGEYILNELDQWLKITKTPDAKGLLDFLDTTFTKYLGKPYSIDAALTEFDSCLQRNPIFLKDTLDEDTRALGLIYKYIDKAIEIAWDYLSTPEQHKLYSINKYLLTIICGAPEVNHNKLKNFLADKNFSIQKIHQIDYKNGLFYVAFKANITQELQYDYIMDCTGIKGYYTSHNPDLLAKSIIKNKQIKLSKAGKIIVDTKSNVYYKDSNDIINNVYAIGEVSHGPGYATGCFASYALHVKLATCSILSKYQDIK